MKTENALALIFARNAFYKRLHFLALGALALNVLVIIILIFILIFLIRSTTPPIYFATDNLSRLIHIVPITEPNMTDNEVVSWTTEAVKAAYSFDFVNYPAQLQSAQKYFTNYGWTNYMKALSASRNLIGIRERKLIGIAQIVEQPKLIARGLLSGAFAWKFAMPVLITYMEPPYNEENQYRVPLTVSIIVQRQPILQSYRGLGILQIISQTSSAMPVAPREIPSTPTTR